LQQLDTWLAAGCGCCPGCLHAQYSAHTAVVPAQVDDWLAEAGVTPPGNGVEVHLWGAGGSSEASTDEGAAAAVDVSLMSPAERAEYEERKLKLRKAMVGVGLLGLLLVLLPPASGVCGLCMARRTGSGMGGIDHVNICV
jgi:hypothetical protein